MHDLVLISSKGTCGIIDRFLQQILFVFKYSCPLTNLLKVKDDKIATILMLGTVHTTDLHRSKVDSHFRAITGHVWTVKNEQKLIRD